jgi:hypothetical protein
MKKSVRARATSKLRLSPGRRSIYSMRWSFICVVLQVALLHFPHPVVSNAVTLSLSSTRVSANVTLTGKFMPSGYVPPHSSLLITLPGANFPSGSTLASASVSVLPLKASSNKLLFEKFTGLTQQQSATRDDLLSNANYRSNPVPASLDYRPSMDFGQSSPTNEEYFGYRITGALCPSVSGTYSFMVYNNDDSFELHLRDDEASSNDAQFQEVVQFALPNYDQYPIYSRDVSSLQSPDVAGYRRNVSSLQHPVVSPQQKFGSKN